MSTTVDQVIERYVLDDRFTAKANKVTKSAKDIGHATKGSAGGMSSLMRSMTSGRGVMGGLTSVAGGLGGALSTVGSVAGTAANAIMRAATAAAAFAAAGAGIGFVALNAAAEMDSLKRGLIAVTGSTEEAERQLKRLREVAKAPALGFPEAIQGSSRLQAAGMSAELAERALKAFGNALGTTGGGKAELDGVTLALMKIQSKGKVTAEEIDMLGERLAGIRTAMIAAFGTADTEKIQKMGIGSETFISGIITEFEKLPMVTSGLRNSFDNFGDNAKLALASIGETIAVSVLPMIDEVASFLAYITESGLLAEITNGFMALLGVGNAGTILPTILSNVAAVMKTLPGMINNALAPLSEMFDLGGEGSILLRSVAWALAAMEGLNTYAKNFIDGMMALNDWWQSTPMGKIGKFARDSIGLGGGDTSKFLADAFGITAFNDAYARNLSAMTSASSSVSGGFGAFQAAQNSPSGDAASGTSITRPTSILGRIAKATTETARNTKEQIDLQRYALGGGDLGRIGITPVEARRGRSGSRPINIHVTGADESLNRLFTDFLRTAYPLVARG